MTKKVSLKISKVKKGESSVISATLTDEDMVVLSEFCQYARELIETKYFELEQQASLNIKFDHEKGFDWFQPLCHLRKYVTL